MLAFLGQTAFYRGMNVRRYPTLGFMALALGLFAFPQSGFGQEALDAVAISGENDDSDTDDETKSRRPNKGASPGSGRRWTADGIALALADQAEASTSEPVVVRSFDVAPVEYPALPEIEGTKINSGKKTSFVKPDEFP